jgi:hypothetical protein
MYQPPARTGWDVGASAGFHRLRTKTRVIGSNGRDRKTVTSKRFFSVAQRGGNLGVFSTADHLQNSLELPDAKALEIGIRVPEVPSKCSLGSICQAVTFEESKLRGNRSLLVNQHRGSGKRLIGCGHRQDRVTFFAICRPVFIALCNLLAPDQAAALV